MIICCFLSLKAEAQFTDSFADGNFTQNPSWIGDTGHYVVTPGGELRLNAPPQSGSSFLSTPSKAIGGATWEFYVELDFNPSASNYLDVHVASPAPDPDSADGSYFVRIGDTEDEVSLYRKENGSISKLIDGKDGRVDMNPVTVRIRLTRTGTGDLELFSDSSGGTNYVSEGSVFDDGIQKSKHFSIHCTYTSTRSDKFYFDEFQVSGSPFQDSIPPSIDSLYGKDKGVLALHFDEPVQLDSLKKNELELKKHGPPDSIVKNGGKGELYLHFPSSLPNDQHYELFIPPIKDTAGNSSDSDTLSFLYLVPDEARPNAVVINEIMPDPSPSVALPEREYLELHAADSLILELKDWVLLIGGDSVTLPHRILRPGDRILLAEKADSSLFGDPKGLYFNSLPPLKNSQEKIVLYGPGKGMVDSIHYTDDWYRDPDKDDGGWSLERIDPASPCKERMNWKASNSPTGGTPGKVNSVLDPSYDEEAAHTLQASMLSEDSLLLKYNEPVFPEGKLRKMLHIPDGPVIDSVLRTENKEELLLQLQSPIDTGRWYVLRSEPLPDCFGNQGTDPLVASFILPFTPRNGDLVINELLFDPVVGGEKFVECYNRSSRILDMKDWSFAHFRDSVTGHEKIDEETLIAPGEYLFFSEEPGAVKDEYPKASMERAIEMDRLPSYRRDSGEVILLDERGLIIDRFPYHEEMHHPLLQTSKGVSLERIDPDATTKDPENWHSAAGPEYATPGYRNSQKEVAQREKEERLWTEPRIFSPDLDGDRDLLKVHYRFSKAGMSCSISIHDAQGVLIKKLANGELLGREGHFIWDGTRRDLSRAPLGIYVVLMDCIHPDGERLLEKSSCVLGTRWKGN